MKIVPQETKDQVVQYVQNFPDVSMTQIAKIFGVERHSVSVWCGKSKRDPNIRNSWQKEKIAKAKFILIQFLGGQCEECGFRGCDDALDFHHKDPATKVNDVSRLLQGNFDVALDEAKKCRLICANCHRQHHSQ